MNKMFLNDTLTHWAWVVPMIIICLSQLFVESKYIKNDHFMGYSILIMFITIFFFILGKIGNFLDPEKIHNPKCNDVDDVDCIKVVHNIYHHIFYCFIVFFICLSLVFTGLAFF